MSKNRPFTLTIAGFDPTGGAGVLADIKTFEQHRVYGFAINTANTIQTENTFYQTQWTPIDFIVQSIETLFENYKIESVKIGIVPSLDYLKEIILSIKKKAPTTKIVWDPVLKSSTEFGFLKLTDQGILIEILKQIDLITPNFNEIKAFDTAENNTETIANSISLHCDVLLKGGHNPYEIGVDYLYSKNDHYRFLPKTNKCHEKHGSGCVLSAAITANLALGKNLKTACEYAKAYTENYLQSNPTKLGYHHV